MNTTIQPCSISGTIEAPSSKSMAQRAIASALLAKGKSTIYNKTWSDDSLAALEVITALGATVKKQEDKAIITGGFNPSNNSLNCGEAGLGTRMFTPIACLHHETIHISGEGSLLTRPVDMLEQPLTQLGALCKSNNGLLPLELKGPLLGGKAIVDGSISSQMLTGLLLALPLAKNDTELIVEDLKSKPYIDMTIEVLSDFGIIIEHDNYKTFHIQSGQQYTAREYQVEGDWSGASFLLAAAAVGGSVTLNNLSLSSLQADKEIINALKSVGAILQYQNNSISVKKGELKPYQFDATECPDLFPPLVSLAANCDGKTVIKGVSRLKHKESDRALVLQKEFFKIGIEIKIEGDYMYVFGGKINGGTIDSNNDHRIAMTGAIAAINAKDPIIILGAECINKSYPEFFDDFNKICIFA